jgi:hypothetical protein
LQRAKLFTGQWMPPNQLHPIEEPSAQSMGSVRIPRRHVIGNLAKRG